MDWGILGHEWAVSLLKEHIAREQLRHAYLLTGPQGVGRRTLAIGLAQAINCPFPLQPGEPCRVCHVCKRFQEMTHPDLSIIQAEEAGGVLKVDQVRELQHSLALTPYESRYRIALLIRFEEAHISAQNALLKTLEEPNPQVVMILTASNPEALLPTIVSRCELLRLRPLPISELGQTLHSQLGITDERAQLLAHVSSGRPGYAIDLHNHPEKLTGRSENLDDLIRLLSATRQERFAYAESLARDKDTARARNMLVNWISFWRDVLLSASQSATPLTNLDYSPQIARLAGVLDPVTAFQHIAQTERTLDLTTRNVNLRLALEVLVLDLPRISESLSA